MKLIETVAKMQSKASKVLNENARIESMVGSISKLETALSKEAERAIKALNRFKAFKENGLVADYSALVTIFNSHLAKAVNNKGILISEIYATSYNEKWKGNKNIEVPFKRLAALKADMLHSKIMKLHNVLVEFDLIESLISDSSNTETVEDIVQ